MNEAIGAKLRQTREQRHLTIQQVSETTKVRAHYIQALENDDLSVMPSAAQARGFLRLYSEFLGLNVADITSTFAVTGEKIENGTEHVPPAPTWPAIMDESKNSSSTSASDSIKSKSSPSGVFSALLTRLSGHKKPNLPIEDGLTPVRLQSDEPGVANSGLSSTPENPESTNAQVPARKSATTADAIDKKSGISIKSIPLKNSEGSSAPEADVVKKKEIK